MSEIRASRQRFGVALLAASLIYAVCVLWAPVRWPLLLFQFGVFAGALAAVLNAARHRRPIPVALPVAVGASACVWALCQIGAGSTVVSVLTVDGALYWLSASSVLLLASIYAGTPDTRVRLLQYHLYAGVAISVVGIVQCFTSAGKVLWLFPTGYDSHVIGPFVYHNNYAAFAELLVPVALWLALEKKHVPMLHLGMAAWLVASVFASGSRAGTVLVLAEVIAMFLILSLRANRIGENLRAAAPFLVVLALATVVCGHEFVLSRFQNAESYDVRRSFLQASLAMFKASPITGFGLGAWPFAYKAFATMDTGAFANHAHNEWAQWGAEGGVVLVALMIALFVWTVRAAWKSVWALGVIAVFVHGAVDYPFLRLGLAVWIFALVGILSGAQVETRRVIGRTAAACAALLLLSGLTQAVRLACSDVLFAKDTAESIRSAVAIGPPRTEYLRRLSILEPERAAEHLKAALAINPYDTRSRIELAFELESAGQKKEAEELLREAARLDRQYAPAWALANYYYRSGSQVEFWRWARRSAELAPEKFAGLFELCFAVSDDARAIYEQVVSETGLWSSYVTYLVQSGRSDVVADLVSTMPNPGPAEPLLQASDALLRSGDNLRAHAIWRKLFGDRVGLTNADFSSKITGRGFDWQAHSHSGIEIAQAETLSIALSGEQPEAWDLLTQPLGFEPGSTYVLEIRYRTVDLPAVSGLSCHVGGGEEHALTPSEGWRRLRVKGVVGPRGYLSIRYQRPLGATRAQGRLEIQRIELSAGADGAHV